MNHAGGAQVRGGEAQRSEQTMLRGGRHNVR